MTKPSNEKHPVNYRKYARDHSMCFDLALKHIQQMADDQINANPNVDLSGELIKYQETAPMPGQAFTGAAWVRWFLNSKVPELLEKEKENVRAG